MLMLNQVINAYNEAIFDTDRHKALQVIQDAISQGIVPEDIIFKVVLPNIELMIKAVSQKFDANLAQHFMSSQIAAEVVEEMIPKFTQSYKVAGSVVIGTSPGDFHGLGKKIVIGCLKAAMIEVKDLGLNVSPERFIDEAVALNAQIIGISSMMVHTARGENGSLKVRQILRERDLESQIKIIVGGAPYRHDHDLYKIVQADAWAENGIEAGKVIANLIKETKK